MEDTTLTVRLASSTTDATGNKSFSVTSTVKEIQHFKNWILEYKHGDVNESGEVICRNEKDFFACSLMARRLHLS